MERCANRVGADRARSTSQVSEVAVGGKSERRDAATDSQEAERRVLPMHPFKVDVALRTALRTPHAKMDAVCLQTK